jgi:hypothetical protein
VKLLVSHFARVRQKWCKFGSEGSKVQSISLGGERVHFRLYLSLHSRDIPEASYLPLSRHVLLRIRHSVTRLFEALYCKKEGRGFDSQWCHWNSLMT